ncbi:MAG: hypothetical protein BWY95_00191 [Bacteroidetes bacterium ADurb.BinA104]|nr:MAG: hypothetical protein BWY95_00191 [Bacteroidetes bacterium ADurb.BinA104]
MLYILETRKVPQLRVFAKGRIIATFIPENRGTKEEPQYVGVFRTTSEKKMNFIMKRCPSANIQLKRASTAKLNTLGGSGSGKAKSKKSSGETD